MPKMRTHPCWYIYWVSLTVWTLIRNIVKVPLSMSREFHLRYWTGLCYLQRFPIGSCWRRIMIFSQVDLAPFANHSTCPREISYSGSIDDGGVNPQIVNRKFALTIWALHSIPRYGRVVVAQFLIFSHFAKFRGSTRSGGCLVPTLSSIMPVSNSAASSNKCYFIP